LAEGLGESREGSGGLPEGSGRLREGSGRLREGSGRLAEGLPQMPERMPAPRLRVARTGACDVFCAGHVLTRGEGSSDERSVEPVRSLGSDVRCDAWLVWPGPGRWPAGPLGFGAKYAMFVAVAVGAVRAQGSGRVEASRARSGGP
jgi:X-X-X-Leu-X-X-Gly heptad repeat protein